MKTAGRRLLVFAVVGILLAVLFFFEPALNIGMPVKISMYQQLQDGMPVADIVIKLMILSCSVFFGLIFLIGLSPKQKTEQSEKNEKAVSPPSGGKKD